MRWRGVSVAVLLALALLEGVVRWREWGRLPPGPAEGIRGVVVKAPSTAGTLVVLGDSIPWGYGLSEPENAWPVLLGRELARRGTPWQVVDVSLPGETSLQGWARWRRDVLPWRPQRVILALGTNDCFLRYTPTDAWRWAHVPQGLGRFLRLWHVARVKMLSPPPDEPPQWAPRLTPDQTATVFRMLLRAARASRVEAWMLTPAPPGPQAHADWPAALRAYQKEVCARTRTAMWQVAQEFEAGVIDLWTSLHPPREEWYQPDGVHLSPEGHALVAREILRTMFPAPDEGGKSR